MIHVTTARPDQYSVALEFVLSGHEGDGQPAHVSDIVDACSRGDITLDGLLLAHKDAEPIGAGLFILQADKTAFVWPPSAAAGLHAEPVVDAIFSEICRRVDAAGAWISQCLIGIDETAERSALSRNGFAHLADLCYLQRLVDEPITNGSHDAIVGVPFQSGRNERRFAEILEQTYVGTLDCPALTGTRSGEEAITGHRAAGDFDSSRWRMFRHDEKEIGLMLLHDHPDQDAWEVVYTGVVPEARGKGFGRMMVIDAIRRTRDAGRSALLLAVDARNIPARRIYESVGFREISTRAAHVRVFPKRDPLTRHS